MRREPPTPDLTLTIKGIDRYLVAEALIEACRGYETLAMEARAVARPQNRKTAGSHSQACADRLRAIYDQVVP